MSLQRFCGWKYISRTTGDTSPPSLHITAASAQLMLLRASGPARMLTKVPRVKFWTPQRGSTEIQGEDVLPKAVAFSESRNIAPNHTYNTPQNLLLLLIPTHCLRSPRSSQSSRCPTSAAPNLCAHSHAAEGKCIKFTFIASSVRPLSKAPSRKFSARKDSECSAS
jgi:hypothetical protein